MLYAFVFIWVRVTFAYIISSYPRLNKFEFFYLRQILNAPTDIITRSKQLRVNFSCVYPTSSKVSGNGFDTKDVVPQILKEEQGNGEFHISINLYTDGSYTNLLENTDQPMEVSVQDRIFFEVKLDSNDDRLTVFAENCSVTPTPDKNDARRYYLTKSG